MTSPAVDLGLVHVIFFQDWVSVTHSGSKDKLLIPLRAVYGAESSADDTFWPITPPILAQTLALPNTALDSTASKSDTTDSANVLGCPCLEVSRRDIQALSPPAQEVIHRQSRSDGCAQNQNSHPWSPEELKYYEAVLAAEEARKESEEPDPGLTRI